MEPVAVELPTAALELIASDEPFDIAVLDMMMPEMDGLALAGEIRNRRNAEELPLLLLTSLGRLPQARVEQPTSPPSSRSRSRRRSSTTRSYACSRGAPSKRRSSPWQTESAPRSALRILLAEDNAMNQKVALRLLERLGYRADVAIERARGDRDARATAVRRRPDGRPDAGARRPRRDAPDLRALVAREPPAHHRDDGERAARGSRGVLRGRHGRLRREADPRRGARGGAQARASPARTRTAAPRRSSTSASTTARSRTCASSAATSSSAR